MMWWESGLSDEQRAERDAERETQAEDFFKAVQTLSAFLGDDETQKAAAMNLMSDAPTELSLPTQQLPTSKRIEHMMVVAGSGSGKTQLFQEILLGDIYSEATIIVIDSQAQLIDNLLHVVPSDRLVHLTPTDKRYPLALNLFDQTNDSSLYEYIFQAFGGEMTPQMGMIYRYVARLVSVVPGGNLETMRKVLEKNGASQYRQHFDKLPPLIRDFFLTQFDTDRSILESRQAVLRRVYAALENDAFAAMFTAKENKVDLAKEMADGKIILIDTAKGTLKGDTFKIFGRFCLAQIAQAIFSRQTPYENPVYIYIDEFADYAGDEGFVLELFTQARKWNVGLIVAFQFLGQLPEQVLKAVMSNTAIKFIGKVSAADERAMAAELRLKAQDIWQWKGRFHINFKNPVNNDNYWDVPFGQLEALPKRSRDELEAIRYEMRKRYSEPVQEVVPQESDENPDDVEEASPEQS